MTMGTSALRASVGDRLVIRGHRVGDIQRHVEVLPMIDLAAELGTDADPDAAYDLVTGRMQDVLDELAEARAFPVIG